MLELADASQELSVSLYASSLVHVARSDEVGGLSKVGWGVKGDEVDISFYPDVVPDVEGCVDRTAADVGFPVVGAGEGIATADLKLVCISGSGRNSLSMRGDRQSKHGNE